jgi:hypothetical protein
VPYTSEVEVMNALGIESWRNLSKNSVFELLGLLPEIDREVALKIIDQIPEFTKLALGALDDVAKGHNAALASNDRNMEMVNQFHLEILAILKAELDKDLTPEQWMRVVDELRDVRVDGLLKDTENKRFNSEQFDKRLRMTGMILLGVVAVVLGAGRSAARPTL